MNIFAKDFEPHIDQKFFESESFENWLTTLSRITKPQEGLGALLEVIASINAAIGEIFADSHESINHLSLALKHTTCVISLVDLISDLQWWTCQEARSKQEKISMFLFTSLKCARSALFLLELGGVKPNGLNASIGRLLLIDLVLSLLTIGGIFFNLWNNMKELDKGASQTEANINLLKKFANKMDSSPKKIQKWTKITQTDKIAGSKIWIAIALDISNIAATLLALLVTSKGLSTSPLIGRAMIFLGIATSVFWLYKCYYEEKYREFEIYIP